MTDQPQTTKPPFIFDINRPGAGGAGEVKAIEISAPNWNVTARAQIFTDVCDELGCAYDNAAPLVAVRAMKTEIERLRAVIRVNALRWNPTLTHEEIERVIEGN